jgi:enamine deaminase RidA (YjgF/YER057c/UK114 family)
MSIIRKNIEQLGLPVGPYTHAVVHGQTLYTSGFTAFGTPAQTGSAHAQAQAVLNQLETLALEFGRSLEDLIKVTVFVTDPTDIPQIRDALSQVYGDAVPASSLLFVSALFAPELKIEIEAIFAV